MSPRTGRPKAEKPKAAQYGLRLDVETERKLVEYCSKHGLKKSAAIRLAIDRMLSEDEK